MIINVGTKQGLSAITQVNVTFEDTLNLMAIALLAANNGECSIISNDNWKFAIIDAKNNLLIGKAQKTDKWEVGCSPNVIMNALLGLNSYVNISQKADKAETLAGYGIKDAKIENGYITLGDKTLFPVIHQDLYGMTTLASLSGIIGTHSLIDNYEWDFVIVDSQDYVLFGKRKSGSYVISPNLINNINTFFQVYLNS